MRKSRINDLSTSGLTSAATFARSDGDFTIPTVAKVVDGENLSVAGRPTELVPLSSRGRQGNIMYLVRQNHPNSIPNHFYYVSGSKWN